jgi:hypothetical protein
MISNWAIAGRGKTGRGRTSEQLFIVIVGSFLLENSENFLYMLLRLVSRFVVFFFFFFFSTFFVHVYRVVRLISSSVLHSIPSQSQS